MTTRHTVYIGCVSFYLLLYNWQDVVHKRDTQKGLALTTIPAVAKGGPVQGLSCVPISNSPVMKEVLGKALIAILRLLLLLIVHLLLTM